MLIHGDNLDDLKALMPSYASVEHPSGGTCYYIQYEDWRLPKNP